MYVQSILAAKGDEVATITPDASVREAVALLNERRVGALVVSTDGRHIDGILSERDVVRSLGSSAAGALDQSVADLMTREVTTCAAKDTIEQLMWLMTDQRIRHLPVADESGQLAGIVSIGDVVRAVVESQQFRIASLENYIMS
jgi:CBS domain-containing protein